MLMLDAGQHDTRQVHGGTERACQYSRNGFQVKKASHSGEKSQSGVNAQVREAESGLKMDKNTNAGNQQSITHFDVETMSLRSNLIARICCTVFPPSVHCERRALRGD